MAGGSPVALSRRSLRFDDPEQGDRRMRIIPACSSRTLILGVLVAATLPTARAEARQDATAERQPAAPPARTDGWKPKGPVDGTERAGAAPSAATRTLQVGDGQRSLAAEKAAIDKVTAKTSIAEILAVTLPSRTDTGADWSAGPEPLHRCGEPRWIEPCIPLPPCHPSLPPHPFDLVGVPGEPTDGPIYGGPCCPRTGSRDDGPWPHLHRVHDRLFDAFYRTK